ncbi:MAG: hypothetical protein V3S68_05675 [Dehalococcoidia bacterium]
MPGENPERKPAEKNRRENRAVTTIKLGFDYHAGRVQDSRVENLIFFVRYGGIDTEKIAPRIVE